MEFNPASPFFNQRRGPDDEFGYLRHVIYQEDRPAVVLTGLDDFSPFLTKSSAWSYETEWRMMMPLSSASTVVGVGATAVHLFEFPRTAIRRVILGCRTVEKTAVEIRHILRASREYEGVACVQVRLDDAHYRILIDPAW